MHLDSRSLHASSDLSAERKKEKEALPSRPSLKPSTVELVDLDSKCMDGLHDLVRNTLLEGVRNFLLENARKFLMENVRKQSYMVENVRNLLDFVRNLFLRF